MFPPKFPPLKQLCSRRFLTGLVTLFCFFTTSVGFPLEPLGTPQAGCQCGHELQSSGGCCCSRAKASPDCESQTRSCCIQKQTKSCCAGKQKSESKETSPPILISACGCGHGPAAGTLINDDPRLPGHPTLVLSSVPVEFFRPLMADVLPEHCLSPETPPPEVCSL